MKKRAVFTSVGLGLLIAANILAADLPRPARHNSILHGGVADLTKAAGDTIDLMGPSGSGATYIGDFEAGWNGWTSLDATEPSGDKWHVSDYNQSVPGNLAAWCGSLNFPSCGGLPDPVGGYGNNWSEYLEFRSAVTDPLQSATVHLTAVLQHDTEPAEDYVMLNEVREGDSGFVFGLHWDGTGTAAVDELFAYLPGEYVDGTDVVLLFRVVSDGGWSDEDCQWPTAGACQLDDVTVTISQPGLADVVSFTDFQDGTLGDWNNSGFTGAGNFAQIWSGLEDLDPCATNYSNQVAFIDDGLIVPGTGGADCINWCYGPSGYIVNTTGGLRGPGAHIENYIMSPVMAWPNASADGLVYSFDVYRHEDLSADAPGIFYTWAVRSADTDNSAGDGLQILAEQPFMDRNYVYWEGPEYLRAVNNVTDLIVAGRDEVQLRLGVLELGWAWGWVGEDGYPAPYFDNVSAKVFAVGGPVITVLAANLAQDNFPESDVLTASDPGSMHVRFDAALDIAAAGSPVVQPGDSLVAVIASVRSGGVLVGAPEMVYTIDANPAFDAFRSTPVSGAVPGSPVLVGGAPVQDSWAFDLPDTGTLFPGDVLHYYFSAWDAVGGDFKQATLPADLNGYGVFGTADIFDPRFTVNALPDMWANGSGGYNTRNILVWDDSGDPEMAADLFQAMTLMGFHNDKTVVGKARTFDFYFTTAADQGLGNGLGGRTSGSSLMGYSDLLYRSGDNALHTLTSGDPAVGASNDISTIGTWLAGPDNNLMLSGDNYATDLVDNNGLNGLLFANNVMGIDVATSDIRPFISNQANTLVKAVSGNPVFFDYWYVTGGCPIFSTFDGHLVRPGSWRLAEFTDPNGNMGAYSFSAATLNIVGGDSRIISLPYDIAKVSLQDPSGTPAPFSANNHVLDEILVYFGYGVVGPVPEVAVFSVSSYPNPFNPSTRIEYSVVEPGHLSLKIYNLRGELVRTLINEQVEASGHVMWDGTDEGGAQVASGVYFREARMGGEVFVAKMALIK